jgi:DNA processing protein
LSETNPTPDPAPTDLRDFLALHLVPGLGPRLTTALLERFGSAANALKARPDQLQEIPHIGSTLAQQLWQAMQKLDVDAELELMAKHQVQALLFGQPAYPQSLAELPQAPHLLYMRGNLLPSDTKAVAIVGSRHCTSYGKRVAEQLARGLVQAGYTVVSGLARGIDGVAHRAALQVGGRTLAVLAGGLSKIYPPEHDALALEVVHAGALLSETGMRMEPMGGMFPARNRIISGLSKAVVIVEAAQRSGALITASHAAEQGRPVLAVPGPIDSEASGGTNSLIRKGAILVRGVDDILEELEGAPGQPSLFQEKPRPTDLDETQQQLWDFLADQPRHLDEIAQSLKLPVPKLSGLLMTLEMRKLIRRLPGNR